MPAPARDGQPEAGAMRQIVIVGLANSLRGNTRMQIDGHGQLFGPREDRSEPAVIEEEIFGQPVNQGATEAKIAYRALQFVGCRIRTAHRQMSKGREAIGMLGDGFCDPVVEVARERDALKTIDEIGTWTREREHLCGDSRLVHFAEPKRADLWHLLFHGRAPPPLVPNRVTAPRDRLGADPAYERGNREVFL